MKWPLRIVAIAIIGSAITITITGGIMGDHVSRWEVWIWGSSQVTITLAWFTAMRSVDRYQNAYRQSPIGRNSMYGKRD